MSHSVENSKNNRKLIEDSEKVSCYFCIEHFDASDVTEYCDKGQTALCPKCDVDAILPGEVPLDDLSDLCEKWFCGCVESSCLISLGGDNTMVDASYLIVTLALNAANKKLSDNEFRKIVLNSVSDVKEVKDWIKNNPDRAEPLVKALESRN